MNKRFMAIALLFAVIAAGVWYMVAVKSGSWKSADPEAPVGKLAAQFSLEDLNGNIVSQGQPGKVTVLNFWTTWCPSCREEMPELQSFATAHVSDVTFWTVNIREPAAKVTAFLEDNKYSLPVLLDSDGRVANSFRINAIPTTVIIDEKGMIRFRKTGGVTRSELENILKGL